MEDEQLVQRAQAGDAHAFGRLVDRHYARIYATVVKMTGDSDLALDLTQDAFVRAWERIGRFERRSAFSTWLYRIAVRLTYDALRSRRRRDHRPVDERLADPAPRPDERAEATARAIELRARIEMLPAMQRAIVTMRTFDEMAYKEIADILDTTENSARVSFHHAIRKLRDGFAETDGI